MADIKSIYDRTDRPYIHPVLKARKHIYFDTLCLKSIGPHDEVLFNNCMTFPDGRYKEPGVDTNMQLCGSLGIPLIFDLIMWSIVFEEFGSGEDIRQVLSKMSLRFVSGGHTTVHSSVGSEFYPGLTLTDGFGREWIAPGKPPLRSLRGKYRKLAKLVQGQIRKASKVGTWTHWYQALDIGRKARRIDSTDWVGVDVKVSALNLSKPVQLKIGWHGILYAP